MPEGNKSRVSGVGVESNRPATSLPGIPVDSDRVDCLVEKSCLDVAPQRIGNSMKQGESVCLTMLSGPGDREIDRVVSVIPEYGKQMCTQRVANNLGLVPSLLKRLPSNRHLTAVPFQTIPRLLVILPRRYVSPF